MSRYVVLMKLPTPVTHSSSLLNHPDSFPGGMFKLNTKFGADLLLSSCSHFECDNHTVHMLTQQLLPPPLTSTVKSFFMHAHSSPLLGCQVILMSWKSFSLY